MGGDLERPSILVTHAAEGRSPCSAYLRNHGYRVRLVRTPEPGGCDLVLALARELEAPRLGSLARRSDAPAVIALWPEHEQEAGVAALEQGADDAFSCAGSRRELLARVRAILRRREAAGRSAARRTWARHGYDLDEARSVLARPPNPSVRLSPGEFDILRALSCRPGEVLSRAELLDAAAARPDVYDRAVDSLVRRLRRKMVAATGRDPIVTHRAAG